MTSKDGTAQGDAAAAPLAFAGPAAIRRICFTTAWFGAVAAIAFWVYLGWRWSLGYVGGTVTGIANIFFLSALTREVLTTEQRNKLRIFLLLAIKVVVVYGGLAALRGRARA